jgi:ATP-dependent RNA helicase DDX21
LEAAAPRDLDTFEIDPTAMLEEALAAEPKPAKKGACFEDEAETEAVQDAVEDEPDDHLGELGDPTRPLISSFDIDKATVALLAAKGILNFTPIQAESYNLLKSGSDMLARSRTGTGKTLAFALPLIQALAAQKEPGARLPRGRKPRMIVLAPTRELARQVGEVCEMLAGVHQLRTVLFHGGVPYPPQQRALREGVDLLVGTPGRIIDHLNDGALDLSEVQYAVLDEADEMLNMGFKDDVETILQSTDGQRRQTVLFSATHPPWVKSVAREYQKDPKLVDVVGSGKSEAASTVEHIAVLTPEADAARARTLADLIAVHTKGKDARCIVFTATKREVDDLCVSAALAPIGAQPLHGDISQKLRETTLQKFRDGHFSVLVATDVAARGIDVQGVDLIVQYR